MSLPEFAQGAPEPAGRDYLADLLSLSRALNASMDLSEVLEMAMEMVMEFVSAERGFIMLRDSGGGPLRVRTARNIDPAAIEQGEGISSTVISQVADTGLPVLSHNAMQDPRFSGSSSVVTSGLRSVMCVPLRVKGEVAGIVYLDNRLKAGIFNDRQLEMLLAFASQASVAIEKARLYQALQKQMQQTKALEQSKAEFISTLSHELRSPLTPLRNYVELLEQDFNRLDQATREQYFEHIKRFISNLFMLTNDIFVVNEVDSEDAMLHLEPHDLVALVNGVIQTYKMERPGYVWRLELDSSFHYNAPRVELDPERMAHCFRHLLSNAAKFSERGSTITVHVLPAAAPGQVDVSVTDQGIGIRPDRIAGIFESLTQVAKPEGERYSGLGIGLYVARRIVEAHGGRISCLSQEGKGSTFTVTLPLQSPQRGRGSR